MHRGEAVGRCRICCKRGTYDHRGASSRENAPRGVHVIGGLDELPQLLVSEFARIGVPAQR